MNLLFPNPLSPQVFHLLSFFAAAYIALRFNRARALKDSSLPQVFSCVSLYNVWEFIKYVSIFSFEFIKINSWVKALKIILLEQLTFWTKILWRFREKFFVVGTVLWIVGRLAAPLAATCQIPIVALPSLQFMTTKNVSRLHQTPPGGNIPSPLSIENHCIRRYNHPLA